MAKIKFKLKHLEGVTLFKIIEQEGIARGCGEIFEGDNGWKIFSRGSTDFLEGSRIIFIGGLQKQFDDKCIFRRDPNKEIYNNVLETFKQLGNFQTKKFEPKGGDKVLVRDAVASDWKERLFITKLSDRADSPYITVADSDEERYTKGESFYHTSWKHMKPLHKKESSFKQLDEETFEVTFEMNEKTKE